MFILDTNFEFGQPFDKEAIRGAKVDEQNYIQNRIFFQISNYYGKSGILEEKMKHADVVGDW